MAKPNHFLETSRLRALRDDPVAQAAYAAELVADSRHAEAVRAAAKVLAAHPRPAARAAILARYGHLGADPNKRDQGAHVRTALLEALRPVSRLDDVPLLEEAALTYEVLPTSSEDVTGGLRATALLILAELDGERASFHAVRLLHDARAAAMSGEPAVTAAGVLAAQQQIRVLYGYVTSSGRQVPEAVSECLRYLVALPETLLGEVVARWIDADDPMALVGLVDLLLAHPAGFDHAAAVRRFLAATELFDAYRYALLALMASRDEHWMALAKEADANEVDPAKRLILDDAFAEAAPGEWRRRGSADTP